MKSQELTPESAPGAKAPASTPTTRYNHLAEFDQMTNACEKALQAAR